MYFPTRVSHLLTMRRIWKLHGALFDVWTLQATVTVWPSGHSHTVGVILACSLAHPSSNHEYKKIFLRPPLKLTFPARNMNIDIGSSRFSKVLGSPLRLVIFKVCFMSVPTWMRERPYESSRGSMVGLKIHWEKKEPAGSYGNQVCRSVRRA